MYECENWDLNIFLYAHAVWDAKPSHPYIAFNAHFCYLTLVDKVVDSYQQTCKELLISLV